MLHIKQSLLALLLSVTALCCKADCLWIIGDATPYGWATDNATALLSAADSHDYTGTIYLKANQDFKFMTVPDFGNEEYGAAPGASLTDGEIALAKGTDDNGYGKLQVSEDGNYYISVNTETMKARIEKSAYQESEINMCSLFMVGSATVNGWDVMKGTPLYQNAEKPYEFCSGNVAFEAGTFKIAIDLKGACSWNSEYWYFRDAADDNKIARAQDGDLQWNIAKKDTYVVTVDVKNNSISILPQTETSISTVGESDCYEAEYYTLGGIKVGDPQNGGIFILKKGPKSQIVIIK